MHRLRQHMEKIPPQKKVVAYVSPKTKNWTKEEHEAIIECTLESFEKIIKSSQRVTLVEDFNFSEDKWKTFESGGDNTLENRLLRLTMNNTMIQ